MSAKCFARALPRLGPALLLLPAALAQGATLAPAPLGALAEAAPVMLAARGELFGFALPGVLGDLLAAFSSLPPDSRRYLVVGALLLFVWLLQRRLAAARAAKRAREAKARAKRVGASRPSYPTAGARQLGVKAKAKAEPPKPPSSDRGGTDLRIGAAARAAAREAPAEEEDFTALYRKAVKSPERAAPPGQSAGPGLDDAWLDDEPAPAPAVPPAVEIDLDENDELFSLAGDEKPAAAPPADELFDEDDPLFTLAGDEPGADEVLPPAGVASEDDDGLFLLEDEERAEPVAGAVPVAGSDPDAESDPGPDEGDAEGVRSPTEPEDAAGPEAAPVPAPERGSTATGAAAGVPGFRQIRPRRGQERTPVLVIVEPAGPEAVAAPVALAEAVLAILAGDPAPARVAFAIAPEDVGDAAVDAIAERFHAAQQDPARLCVLVDAALAEADVARVRAFGRSLGAAGIGLGLCAAEPRNRLTVMVKMTSSVLVRFDAAAVDALAATDDGLLELARITKVVRERGAQVLLATADPKGREHLLAGRSAGLRWEYLETPRAG